MTIKNLPQIRIQYAWLLASVTGEALNKENGDGSPLGSYADFQAIAKTYTDWWTPHNDEMLQAICNILGLEFRQNIIDVYVSPWFTPISDPMTVGPGFRDEDNFVNVLIHELIHRLITDNTSVPYEHNHLNDWKKSFGKDHSQVTLVHIPVHAVLKKLYLDEVNRPDLLELDISKSQKYPAYAKAWEYVEQHDYNEIIKQLVVKV